MAEDALRIEEGKKDKLCQELNLLVQQSAHAQLERLEQLTQRMESLNRGFVQPPHSTGEAQSGRSPDSDAKEALDSSTEAAGIPGKQSGG